MAYLESAPRAALSRKGRGHINTRQRLRTCDAVVLGGSALAPWALARFGYAQQRGAAPVADRELRVPAPTRS